MLPEICNINKFTLTPFSLCPSYCITGWIIFPFYPFPIHYPLSYPILPLSYHSFYPFPIHYCLVILVLDQNFYFEALLILFIAILFLLCIWKNGGMGWINIFFGISPPSLIFPLTQQISEFHASKSILNPCKEFGVLGGGVTFSFVHFRIYSVLVRNRVLFFFFWTVKELD